MALAKVLYFFVAILIALLAFISVSTEGELLARDEAPGENGIFERNPLVVEPEDNDVHSVRRKRDKKPRSKLMLEEETEEGFKNRTRYTSHDFIIRFQSRFNDFSCHTLTETRPEYQKDYFWYKKEILYPHDGDNRQKEEKNKTKYATLNIRYRVYGEPCDYDEEWNFWYENFMVAVNDQNAILQVKSTEKPDPIKTTTTSKPEYEYLEKPKTQIMEAFHKVWKKYESKGVCNQKLLLECDKFSKKCVCRRNGVGLSTIHDMSKTFQATGEDDGGLVDQFIVRHYYDAHVEEWKSLNPGEEDSGVHGLYKFSDKCVLISSLPGTDVQISNPCDFLLPNLGKCQAECVTNATCKSVEPEEQEQTAAGQPKTLEELYKKRVVRSYWYKCVCDPGKTCFFNIENGTNDGTQLQMPYIHRAKFMSMSMAVLYML